MWSFSEDLKRRVLERYSGDNQELRKALDYQSPSKALSLLDEYSKFKCTPEYIIELLESGRGNDLLATAKDIKLRQDLYHEAQKEASACPLPWRKSGSDIMDRHRLD